MRNEIEIGSPFAIAPLRPLPMTQNAGRWDRSAPALFAHTTEAFRSELADVYWRVLTRTVHDGGGTGLRIREQATYAEAFAAKILLACGETTTDWWSLYFDKVVTGEFPGAPALKEIAREVQGTTGFFFGEGRRAAVRSAELNVADCVKRMVKEVTKDGK